MKDEEVISLPGRPIFQSNSSTRERNTIHTPEYSTTVWGVILAAQIIARTSGSFKLKMGCRCASKGLLVVRTPSRACQNLAMLSSTVKHLQFCFIFADEMQMHCRCIADPMQMNADVNSINIA